MDEINGNMFDRKVINARPDSVFPLPLNLIALIISYLDRPSDLGRMCRTCRVFHYMSLPQLYSSVSLRSYDHIRYAEHDGRPEGCGMGSPFTMGLSGLVSRSVSNYVRVFEVCGEWKEHDLAECAKVGRVPDGSMLLNSLVRVAMEKMSALEEFRWEMNTKMLPTIWQGLSQKQTLKRLTVRFPNKRDPRPMTLAPPIPSLTHLFVHDMDPLCYADDISLLLLGCKNLRHLKMHWSPRMREANEPSIHPSAYFGRIESAQTLMKLETIAICNFFAYNNEQCGSIFDPCLTRSMTLLNSTASIGDGGSTAFTDRENWRSSGDCILPNLKTVRVDKVSRSQCEFIGNLSGLERLFLVGPQARASIGASNGNSPTNLPRSPESSTNSCSPSSTDSTSVHNLKEAYLSMITSVHGPTLTHLLLLPQWRLTEDDIALLVRACPNLEQLALGTDFGNFSRLRLLIPFLHKLIAIRLLPNPDDPTFDDKMRELDRLGAHQEKIGDNAASRQWSILRFLELGSEDVIYEVGPRYKVEVGSGGDSENDADGNRSGKETWRRLVKKVDRSRVAHLPIWEMDSLDI